MKAFSIIFLFGLLAASMAVQLGANQHALIKKPELDLKTPFGRTILDFLQMTEIAETTEVINVMAEVKADIEEQLSQTETSFATEQAAFETAEKNTQDLITSTQGQLGKKRNELAQSQEDEATYKANWERAEATLAKAQSDIVAENTRRKERQAELAQKMADLSEAIGGCSDALKLLEQLRNKDIAAENQITAGAFVQFSSTLEKHLQQVSAKISNIQKIGSTVGSLVNVLMEVAAAGVNGETINKIEAMIGELRSELQNELAETEKAEADDLQYHTETINELNGIVEAQTLISQNNEQKYHAQVKVTKELSQTVKELEDTLASAQETLRTLQEGWAKKKAHYENLIELLRGDVEALNLAINFLKKQTLDE